MSFNVAELRKACSALSLDAAKCKELEEYIERICRKRGKGRGDRQLSQWQLCIKKERTGKPFDPDAMKKLSEKYHRGECP